MVKERTNGVENSQATLILEAFRDQAENPPGKDACISDCYKALLDLQGDGFPVDTFISELLKKKPFTPAHFVNLFFRGAQFMELSADGNNYPRGFDVEKWRGELERFMTDEEGRLAKLLVERQTSTTIYQRYAGPRAILSAMYDGNGLRVADFGCGGNYGLPGIMTGENFIPIKDNTSRDMILQLLSSPIHIEEGVSVDKEDPRTLENINWRHACSFYPQELDGLPNIIDFETRTADVPNCRFVHANLLDIPIGNNGSDIHPGTFDAVIISTILYQMSKKEQDKVLGKAEQALNRKGILIAQEFAEVDDEDPTKLNFDVSWFGKPNMYRTFVTGQSTGWEMLEVLRWNNGRCREVQEGSDFSKFMSSAPYSNKSY